MVAAAVSQNNLNVYPRTSAPSSEKQPFTAGAPEENAFELQRKVRKESSISTFIDVQAESVAETLVSSQAALLPKEASFRGPKDRASNPERLDNSPSFAALQYIPSKKMGGGIELRYDNQPRGRSIDFMA